MDKDLNHKCQFCQKEVKHIKAHERMCIKNPNRAKIKAWNKGLTKETDPRVKQYSETYSERIKSGKIQTVNRSWSDEEKANLSIKMKEIAKNNPNSYKGGYNRGRCKTYNYKGHTFIGSWELDFAKWCDDNNIRWSVPDTPFLYEWNGKRSYYPDFYLNDFDLYIEIKGYETERDLAKWDSVKNLLVIKSKEIKLIRNNLFSLPI